VKVPLPKLVRIREVIEVQCQHCKQWWKPKTNSPKRCGKCRVLNWMLLPLRQPGQNQKALKRAAKRDPTAARELFRGMKDNRRGKKQPLSNAPTKPLLHHHYTCPPCRLEGYGGCCECKGHEPSVQAAIASIAETVNKVEE